MDSAEMRALVVEYIAAYNAMDIIGMLSTLHPDVEFKNISRGNLIVSADGIDDFRDLAEQTKALFSERRQLLLEFAAKDDQAVAMIAFRAVVANGPKKGLVISMNGHSEYTFRDGAICKIWDIS